MNIINSISTGIVAGLTTVLGLICFIIALYFVVKPKIERIILQFVQSPDDSSPSPFALLCKSIAALFGEQISVHLKATFLGLQSVEAKNERREVAAGIIGGNSLLSALVSSFPAVGKKMGRNPALAAFANMAMERFGAPSGGNNHQSSTESPKFKL